MRFPRLDGFSDPVAVMVLGAGPADVETVIVDGDVIKRDGKLVGDHVDRFWTKGIADVTRAHHRLH